MNINKWNALPLDYKTDDYSEQTYEKSIGQLIEKNNALGTFRLLFSILHHVDSQKGLKGCYVPLVLNWKWLLD